MTITNSHMTLLKMATKVLIRVTITDDAPSDGSTQQQLETINISPQISTMDGPGDPNEFRYGIII